MAIALTWLAFGMLLLPTTTAGFPAAFAITTPQQHRLISLEPESAAVLLSLNQAILYPAMATSGLIHGLGIEWIGARHVSLLAAALAAAALGSSEPGRRLAQGLGAGVFGCRLLRKPLARKASVHL